MLQIIISVLESGIVCQTRKAWGHIANGIAEKWL